MMEETFLYFNEGALYMRDQVASTMPSLYAPANAMLLVLHDRRPEDILFSNKLSRDSSFHSSFPGDYSVDYL